MAAEFTLRDEPLPPTATHLCIDMQRLFGPGNGRVLDWMPRVLPQIARLCELDPERTIFTRFIPGAAPGRWLRHLAGLLPALGGDDFRGDWRGHGGADAGARPLRTAGSDHRQAGLLALVGARPPAAASRAGQCDTLVVSGGETDMCVLATVLGAVDLGYRTVLVRDAVCSSSDENHEAMLDLFGNRYRRHVEIGTAAEVAELWR